MEYHYAYAAKETKKARDERMMGRPLWDIYVPLKGISNDLVLSGRRTVFLGDYNLGLWIDFFDWLFEKYGKMFRNPTLTVRMLVGTIEKQRNKLLKKVEEKSIQTSLFPADLQEEIEEINEEIQKINVLEKICYEDIDQFFEFFYHD